MIRALLVLAVMFGAGTADAGRHVVTETTIEILGPLRFVGTTATLAADSSRMLDAIAATLKGNPSIRVMEVYAYGADVKTDQVVLGNRRAKAIVDALVWRGVAAKRLRWSGRAKPDSGPADPGLLIVERAP